MASVEWWRNTSQHMWRTYFALRRQKEESPPDGQPEISDANARIYAACDRIYRERFVKSDQDILRMYFTSRWGDDLYAVEDYSLKHNVPVKVIWIVIRRANREIMEEIGLLERKEEENEDTGD